MNPFALAATAAFCLVSAGYACALCNLTTLLKFALQSEHPVDSRGQSNLKDEFKELLDQLIALKAGFDRRTAHISEASQVALWQPVEMRLERAASALLSPTEQAKLAAETELRGAIRTAQLIIQDLE